MSIVRGMSQVALVIAVAGAAGCSKGDSAEARSPEGSRKRISVVGVQLAFFGFALAVLDFGREIRLKRAPPR